MKDPIEYAQRLLDCDVTFEEALRNFPFLSGDYGKLVKRAMELLQDIESIK